MTGGSRAAARAVGLFTVCATALIGAAVPPADAALPASPVTLASGMSGQPMRVAGHAWTSAGMLFGSDDLTQPNMIVSAAGALVAGDAGPIGGLFPHSVTCTDVVIEGTAPSVRWRNVISGAAGITPTNFVVVGPAPGGWLDYDSNTRLLTRVTAVTGARTTLGTLPGYPGFQAFACDGQRYAVGGIGMLVTGRFDTPGLTSMASAAGVRYSPLAVAGDAVASTTSPSDSGPWRLVRQQVGGAPADIAGVPEVRFPVALTADTTYYLGQLPVGTWGYYPTVFAAPVGAAPSAWQGVFEGRSWEQAIAVVDGDVFVADPQGLHRATATSTVTLWAPPPGHLAATQPPVIGTGRVLWQDNRANGGAARQRSITTSPALAAGPETTIPYGAWWVNQLRADGRRVPGQLVSGDSAATALHDGTAWSPLVAGAPGGLWAHRMGVWTSTIPWPGWSPGRIVDLVDHSVLEVPHLSNLATGEADQSLWHDELVYIDTTSGLRSRNLRTGASSLLVPTAQLGITMTPPPGSFGLLLNWWVNDDFVVWEHHAEPVTGSAGFIAWKQRSTGGVWKVATPTDSWTNVESLDGAHLLVRTTNQTTGQLNHRVFALPSGDVLLSHDEDWQTPPAQRMQWASLGQDLIAWVAGSGEPMIASLPHAPHAPRHEGNPFAEAVYRADIAAAPWHGEWVFDRPLTSCSVAIRNSAAVTVRTLACDPTYAGQGEAVVDWDGKTTAGTPAPAGSYTWAVLAAGAEGAAVDTTGSASITGPLEVRRGTPSYRPVTPSRLLDTRRDFPTIDGVGQGGGPIVSDAPRTVQVTGRAGVPAAGVGAVVVNLTAITPSLSTYLTLYPTGAARPLASNLNLVAGQVAANAAIVKVGAGGGIDIYNPAGSIDVALDVMGWFPDGPNAAYQPLTSPARLTDTRADGQTADNLEAKTGAVQQTEDRLIAVAGRAGIPAGAGAVAVNLTAIDPTLATYLTAHNPAVAMPGTSSLNLGAHQLVPNLALVQVSADGHIGVYNDKGAVQLAVDASGYLPAGAGYTPVTPTRVVDTRSTGALGAAGRLVVPVAGTAGVPATATAVVVNLTGIDPTQATYLSLAPTGWEGATSTLNLGARQVRANLAVVELGKGGALTLYNSAGTTNAAIDIVGWLG